MQEIDSNMSILIKSAKIIDAESSYNGKTLDILIINGIIEKIQKGNHFDLEINHFVDCIHKNQESNKLSMDDAIHQVASMEATYKSIQSNQWVSV